MLEEVGVPYRVELVDFAKKEQKSAAYLALNPMGKVPTLVHRGVVITEVAAICAYLADAFPDAKLAPPPSDPARGTYLRWLFFGAGCLEPAIVDRMLNRAPAEEPGRVGYGTFEATLDALEKAITPGPFVLGDRFSAADVYIASQLGWGIALSKCIEPRPAFLAYVERCNERPASQRTNDRNAALTEKLKVQST